MTDYYERVGAQLADLTARGGPRRMPLFGRFRRYRGHFSSVRAQAIALAGTVAVALAVAAVFLASGATHRRPASSSKSAESAAANKPATPHPGPPALRNYAGGKPPSQAGQEVCHTALLSPGGSRSASGDASVFLDGHGRDVLVIRASGLTPSTHAVWLDPLSGRSQLLGFVLPAVHAYGVLIAVAPLPVRDAGSYRLVLTAQRTRSPANRGPVILGGWVSF